MRPPRDITKQIIQVDKPHEYKALKVGVHNAPVADGCDGIERRHKLRAIQANHQPKQQPWMLKPERASPCRAVQKGRGKRGYGQKRQAKTAADLRHALVQRLRDRPDSRGLITDDTGPHRVARRGHAIEKADQEKRPQRKKMPFTHMLFEKKPQGNKGVGAQSEKPAAVAAAAQQHHTQRQRGGEQRSLRAAARARKPKRKAKAERQQRVDKSVPDPAVKPVKRLARIGHKL